MQIDSDILINEHQTGGKLSQAVNEARRADFGLILAMLSPNVLDHAAFALPTDDDSPLEQTTETLRARFHVPAPQPFAANDGAMVEQAHQHSELVHSAGITSQKLAHYLNPASLAQFNDKQRIADDVLTNCDLVVQQRVNSQQSRIAESMSADPLLLVDVMDKTAKAI